MPDSLTYTVEVTATLNRADDCDGSCAAPAKADVINDTFGTFDINWDGNTGTAEYTITDFAAGWNEDEGTITNTASIGNVSSTVTVTIAEPEPVPESEPEPEPEPLLLQLIIRANSASKTYDGSPLTDNGWFYVSGLRAGDQIVIEETEVTVVGSQRLIGSSPNTITEVTGKVIDVEGNDVTELYEIIYQPGMLTVRPVGGTTTTTTTTTITEIEIPEIDIPEIIIPDEEVPLANLPEEVYDIIDEEVPLGELPATGTAGSGIGMGALGLISLFGMGAAGLPLLKKEDEE